MLLILFPLCRASCFPHLRYLFCGAGAPPGGVVGLTFCIGVKIVGFLPVFPDKFPQIAGFLFASFLFHCSICFSFEYIAALCCDASAVSQSINSANIVFISSSIGVGCLARSWEFLSAYRIACISNSRTKAQAFLYRPARVRASTCLYSASERLKFIRTLILLHYQNRVSLSPGGQYRKAFQYWPAAPGFPGG